MVEHPEYARQGVTLSQFSFQAPRPLQENYVRKRPVRLMNSSDGGDLLLQHPLEVEEGESIQFVVVNGGSWFSFKWVATLFIKIRNFI